MFVLIKILLPIILLGVAYMIARLGYLWTVVATLAVTVLNLGLYYSIWFFFVWSGIAGWLAFSPYTSVFFDNHYNLYIGILSILLYAPFVMSVAVTAIFGIRWGFRRDRAKMVLRHTA